MKAFLLLLLFCTAALAKDPPKPAIYMTYAIWAKPVADGEGKTLFVLLATDGKGHKIVVGVDQATVEKLHDMTGAAISFEQ